MTPGEALDAINDLHRPVVVIEACEHRHNGIDDTVTERDWDGELSCSAPWIACEHCCGVVDGFPGVGCWEDHDDPMGCWPCPTVRIIRQVVQP
jgi:hypothetical protein